MTYLIEMDYKNHLSMLSVQLKWLIHIIQKMIISSPRLLDKDGYLHYLHYPGN